MSERIAQAVWFAILLVCFLAADQALKAQQDTYSAEEKEICTDPAHSVSYRANTGENYSVPFEEIDGQAVVEGDIVIGAIADLPKVGTNYIAPIVPDFVRGQPRRWGNGVAPYVVPYVIDDSVSGSDRHLIQTAMSQWAGPSSIVFQPSGTRDWRREDYVKFSGREQRCSSNSLGIKEKLTPGAVGEEDNINVVRVAGCGSWGNIAHEIGHVLGLGHEQSRSDRDSYIKVLWSNIQKGKEVRYCRAIWDQQTLVNTAYDLDSIMHYPVDGFAEKPDCPTKVTYDGKQQQCLAFLPIQEKVQQQQQLLRLKKLTIGQRDHLSTGDIEAVKMLYPDKLPPQRPAPGLPPTPAQPCTVTTTTIIQVGDRTTTTSKTEPCAGREPPTPDASLCCSVQRPRRPICPPDRCRPAVRVNWPRPDRWCRSEWCRPWPRPRPLCDRDGWIEDRPPSDDWDDRW